MAPQIPDEALLEDLNRVAAKLEKSPTYTEYKNYGAYSGRTLVRRFDGWNNAKDAANLARNTDFPDTELLRYIRENSADNKTISIDRFLKAHSRYSRYSYQQRFGSTWRAVLRAGREPARNVPLSEEDYESYIQAAINANQPFDSLYGLLRGFTGIPKYVLREFDLSWVSRLDDDLQPPLITVPSELISDSDDWELILPTHYTTSSGDKKPTQLRGLIKWVNNMDSLLGPQTNDGSRVNRVIDKAGLNATSGDIRATVAAVLARRAKTPFEIDMQVGASKTNWDRSEEDYFLYLYQFEEYCHPSYEPSGVYLDPDSGEPERVESEGD